jgi:tripartite-type tricarboxylate transporter receptor subunit TctC
VVSWSRLIVVAVGVLWFSASAFAQTYPNRPVKVVVPFPAGGGTDALTRFIAKGMEPRLGQPFIVENRGGAGTTLGATAVARSEPDGYTIMVGTASTFAVAPGTSSHRPRRSDRGRSSAPTYRL